MRFTLFTNVACVIATAVAQTSPMANPPTISSSYAVTAGTPSTFTWQPTTQGPVTLTLRSGAASDLNKGTVIASGIPNSGSYTFTLPEDTTRNSGYTIEISADNDPTAVNYSPQFVVESSNTVASTTPSVSASTAAPTAMFSSVSAPASSAMSMSSSSEISMSSTMSAISAMMSPSSATGMNSSNSAMPTSGSTAGSNGTMASATPSVLTAPSSGATTLGAQGAVVAMILAVFVAAL